MKTALILIGWQQPLSGNWYIWLKKELEKKGYRVFLPDLPTMQDDYPDMQQLLDYIERNIPIDDQTIVFGHSLGAVLGLRLAERKVFNKLFLIAGWDFDDLTAEHRSFWQDKIDHTTIKENVKEIYCITSDNDPFMTAFIVEQMSKRLNGIYVLIENAGHFTEKYDSRQIPQLLSYI